MKINNISLSLFVVYLMRINYGFPQQITLDIGDECGLKDGSRGKCVLDRQCPYVIGLLNNGKGSEIVRCGFSMQSQVVCCKQTAMIMAASSQPPQNQKFIKALCEGNSTDSRVLPVAITDDHIINGEETEIAEFPLMAALGSESDDDEQYNFFCAGSLISEDYVLTAAHCVNNKNIKPKIVRLGKTVIRGEQEDHQVAQDIKIDKWVIHSNYSQRSKLNDIALIKLEYPAKLTYNVFPACLSSKNEGLQKDLIVIGFGVNDTESGTRSGWLLKARIEEFPVAVCRDRFKDQLSSRPIEDTQVCAHNPNTLSDTCFGDSGGPALIRSKTDGRFYVYGITSYGLGCGSSIPSIYTRVDKYLDWIRANMI